MNNETANKNRKSLAAGFRPLNCERQFTKTSQQMRLQMNLMSLQPQLANKIEVCITEALNNILQHAQQLQNTRHIYCAIYFGEHTIRVELRDSGIAYSPVKPEIQTLTEENGRGWFILSQWSDQLKYQRHGKINRLSLSFNRMCD